MSASIKMDQSCTDLKTASKNKTKQTNNNNNKQPKITYHQKTVTSLHRSISSDNFLQTT